MNRLSVFASRIAAVFSRRRLDQEFDQEVEAHLAMLAADNERRGMSPQDARDAARRSFGAVAQIKEEQRERRGVPQIDTLFQDLRYGFRNLLRTPTFTLIAILTLALGIGVNTTLFTTFNAIALKPLPVRDAGEVRRVERWFESGAQGDIQFAFSYPEYVYLRDHSRELTTLIAMSWPFRAFAALNQGDTEQLRGQLVSEEYFRDFGVAPVLGRTFLPEEHKTPGTNPSIVLSYPFWKRRFLADPRILGASLKLNGTTFNIVGVAPQEFTGTGEPPITPDFWAPLMMQAALVAGQNWMDQPAIQRLQILARPKPHGDIRTAEAETATLVQQIDQTLFVQTGFSPTGRVGVTSVRERTVAITLPHATYFGNTEDIRFRVFVLVLMLVVGMVLAIACANLANMLLARAASRQREIGVRLAMGAGRGRLIRQLLTESTLLALVGGAAGLLFSVWAGKLLWALIQHALQGPMGGGAPLTVSLDPDFRVFAYALAISLITGFAFGLAPALRASKLDLTSALKEEGVSFGARMSRSRLRSLLVGSQVAASMILLIAAGLLVRGLVRVPGVDPGFETHSTFWLFFDAGPDPAKGAALQRRVIERLETLPEVAHAAIAGTVPYAGTWTPPIKTLDPQAETLRTLGARVGAGYFETLGIPLERGRGFTPLEIQNATPVAVISANAARQLWPNQEPVGRRLKLDLNFRNQWKEFEVIGVARSVRSAHLSRVDPMMVYVPVDPNVPEHTVLRITGDPQNAQARVRAAMQSIDPGLMAGLALVSTADGPMQLEQVLAEAYTTFAAALAGLALLLASAGIYGVMSYLVSQRVRDIGVMMALGADAGRVLRSVLRQGLWPVLIGSAIGLAGGAAVSILLHSMLSFPGNADLLFGVNTLDPVTFLGLPCLFALIAFGASAIPVRRALKVDPMIALRYDG